MEQLATVEAPPRKRSGLVALFSADLISTLGTWLSVVAVPWLVLQTTGSPAKMGIVAAAEWVPLLLSSVFGPPIVDRLGLKFTSVATDAGSAVVMAAIAAVPRINFGLLVGLIAVAGTLRGGGDRSKHVLLRPMAEDAGTPMIRVQGVYETMNRVAQLIGAPLGGLIIFWAGTQGAIWLDALSFALCGALVAVFVNPKPDEKPASGKESTYRTALRDGLRHLLADRVLVGMTAAMFTINVFAQANVAVLIPLWISDVLRSPAGLGLVLGAYASGAVLGSLTFTAVALKLPRFSVFAIGVLLTGSPRLFALGLSHDLWVVLAVTFVCGVAIAPATPIFGAMLYERVPTELQTRVFGLVAGACIAGFPVGGLLAGWAVSGFGLHPAIMVGAVTCLAATVLSVFLYWRVR
jgi:MFS family permease